MHTVPQIILQQLGGRRFLAMTGAKHLFGSATALTFDLPARTTTNKATKVQITLNGLDLYDIEFMKIAKMTCEVIETAHDIYAEDLQEVFTRATGLYTRL